MHSYHPFPILRIVSCEALENNCTLATFPGIVALDWPRQQWSLNKALLMTKLVFVQVTSHSGIYQHRVLTQLIYQCWLHSLCFYKFCPKALSTSVYIAYTYSDITVFFSLHSIGKMICLCNKRLGSFRWRIMQFTFKVNFVTTICHFQTLHRSLTCLIVLPTDPFAYHDQV